MMQHKTLPLSQLKFTSSDAENDTKGMRLSGYGAVFNTIDSVGDLIVPGAFTVTLATAQKTGMYPSMLLQHGGWGFGPDDLMPLGVWEEMSEDDYGLKLEGQLADIQRGRDVYTLLKMKPRPAISGLSIGYIPKKFTLGTKATEPRRTLEQIELREVSLVTFPANDQARVSGVKSVGNLTEREFEQLMRDAGLSKKEALVVISHGFRHLKTMRDAGSQELHELAAVIQRNTALLTH